MMLAGIPGLGSGIKGSGLIKPTQSLSGPEQVWHASGIGPAAQAESQPLPSVPIEGSGGGPGGGGGIGAPSTPINSNPVDFSGMMAGLRGAGGDSASAAPHQLSGPVSLRQGLGSRLYPALDALLKVRAY
jgi:hypothetical protein